MTLKAPFGTDPVGSLTDNVLNSIDTTRRWFGAKRATIFMRNIYKHEQKLFNNLTYRDIDTNYNDYPAYKFIYLITCTPTTTTNVPLGALVCTFKMRFKWRGFVA